MGDGFALDRDPLKGTAVIFALRFSKSTADKFNLAALPCFSRRIDLIGKRLTPTIFGKGVSGVVNIAFTGKALLDPYVKPIGHFRFLSLEFVQIATMRLVPSFICTSIRPQPPGKPMRTFTTSSVPAFTVLSGRW